MDPKEYLRQLRDGPIDKELPFPIGEYMARVEKVRGEMGREGLDALIVCTPGNLNYLTGYYTFSTTNFTGLVLPLSGEPGVVTSSSEIPAVVLSGWVEDISSFPWHGTDQIAPLLAKVLKARRLTSKRVGIELSRGDPINQIRDELKRALPNARFIDASGLVERVRVVKSPRELALMRKAGKITSIGINASLRAVRAGITDNDVARVGYDALVAAGSEFMAGHPIVNSGHRSSWHHTTFRRVPLKVGDTVFLEYSGCYHRYNAPMMRTAVIGKPSREVQKIADAVMNTLSLIIEGARAGRTAHDVALDAYKGYAGLMDDMWFMELIGYSVGIGFPPTWADGPTFIARGIDKPLLPGMTFHLPVMFRVPRKFGIGISETIAIAEKGCEVLTEKKRNLYIAPVA